MKMDRIIVIDGGRIVAEGTHSSLIKEQGLYQKLWSIQAGGFLVEDTVKEESEISEQLEDVTDALQEEK